MSTQSHPHNLYDNNQSCKQHRTTKKHDRTARLWNRMAKRYAAKPVTDQAAYEHKLAITRNYLHSQAHVLELGCGTGSTAIAHAPYVKHINAIVAASRMIEIAQEKSRSAGIQNVVFSCNAVHNIRLSVERFDAILILNVLHLLIEWRQQISMAYIWKPAPKAALFLVARKPLQ